MRSNIRTGVNERPSIRLLQPSGGGVSQIYHCEERRRPSSRAKKLIGPSNGTTDPVKAVTPVPVEAASSLDRSSIKIQQPPGGGDNIDESSSGATALTTGPISVTTDLVAESTTKSKSMAMPLCEADRRSSRPIVDGAAMKSIFNGPTLPGSGRRRSISGPTMGDVERNRCCIRVLPPSEGGASSVLFGNAERPQRANSANDRGNKNMGYATGNDEANSFKASGGASTCPFAYMGEDQNKARGQQSNNMGYATGNDEANSFKASGGASNCPFAYMGERKDLNKERGHQSNNMGYATGKDEANSFKASGGASNCPFAYMGERNAQHKPRERGQQSTDANDKINQRGQPKGSNNDESK